MRDGTGSEPHVAIITQGYFQAGGVQTVARWLSDGLRRAGFAVQVYDLAQSRTDPYSRRLTSPRTWLRRLEPAPDDAERDVFHVGATAVELEPCRYLPRRQLSRALRRFDSIQVVAGGPALALAARSVRRPLVLQVATTVASERAALFAAPDRHPLTLWRRVSTGIVTRMEQVALRSATRVLVENPEMHEHVLAAGQANVVVAPPGVDVRVFTPAETWSPRGHILSVCRLSDARKGLERMVHAYAQLRSLLPDCPPLVLAGRGELPAQLLRLLRDLGVDGHVSVRSDVPQSELPALYRGASIYLQTSYEEGLGISVLEAMASGVPVVATRTAGTEVTVAHEGSGWLVEQEGDVAGEVARRTLSVLTTDGHRMSQFARTRAEVHFSTDVALLPYVEAHRGYAKVL